MQTAQSAAQLHASKNMTGLVETKRNSITADIYNPAGIVPSSLAGHASNANKDSARRREAEDQQLQYVAQLE